MAFAKIFERPVYGQVLARLATHPTNNKPGVIWAVEPPDFGVCEFGMWTEDTEDGDDIAQRWLDTADEQKADKFAGLIFKACGAVV